MKVPKVIIIILNWNGKRDTVECLNSLNHIDYPDYDILIVDNGSTDDSVKDLKSLFEKILVIQNNENLGFAEGNNRGIRYALENGYEYILLLNNDTIVDRSFLSELVNFSMSHDDIGIVSPVIYFYDKPDIVQSSGMAIRKITGKCYSIDYGKIMNYNFAMERDYLTGCVMLISADVLKMVGGFDSLYGNYWEDIDLSTRIRNNNLRLFCLPTSRIWHKGSTSTGGPMNARVYYYTIKNSLVYFNKHTRLYKYYYYVYLTTVYLILLLGYSLLHNRLYLLLSYKNAIIDYILRSKSF